MKKILTTIIASIALSGVIMLTSCKKDVNINVTVQDQLICFPASAFISGSGVPTVFEISISDIQAAFALAGVTFSPDKVKAAAMKGFKASISTSSVNFNDISGFQVYAKSPGTQGDGSMVAYTNAIGQGTTEVELALNGLELKPFLSSDKILITVRVFNNKDNTPETCFTLKSGYIEIKASK